MTTGTSTRATSSTRGLESYSQAFRKGLVVSAILLAVLPVPVTALHLLPAYRIHARFLVFFAPVVCLLLVAYLLYLRDMLARLMFADMLTPLADDDPYRPRAASSALGRATRRVRAVLLAILPAALVLTSFYCFSRYTARLQDSIGLAVAMQPSPLPAGGEEVGAAAPSAGPAPARATRPARAAPPVAVAEAGMASPRDRVLRTTDIDAIPLFTELTVLYIGIFAAALVAVVLMALKEYAQEAMGLSEQDLVLGGWAPNRDEGPEGVTSR